MALSMFGGALALPRSDIKLLKDVYAIKTCGMARRQRERMPSVSQILSGRLDLNEPYTSHPDIFIDDGATFGGMLYRRGRITRNLRDEVAFAEWDVQDILAMFCSGIDRNLSFDRDYQQTCARIIHDFDSHINTDGGDNTFPVAYTLASMEYEHSHIQNQHYDVREPTRHMHHFAELFKMESDIFYLMGDRTAVASPNDNAANSVSIVTGFGTPAIPVHYERCQFEHLLENGFLAALIYPMPGVYTGTTVTLDMGLDGMDELQASLDPAGDYMEEEDFDVLDSGDLYSANQNDGMDKGDDEMMDI